MHELDRAVALVRDDRLVQTFKIFARVAHIQRMLFEQWAVLETMTPSEYLQFRDALGRASGFQSYQYRALEFVLGNKDENTLKPHEHDPRVHAELAARLAAPSLYDEFLRWLARHGHAVLEDRLTRDFTQPYERSASVLEVFRTIIAAQPFPPSQARDIWNAPISRKALRRKNTTPAVAVLADMNATDAIINGRNTRQRTAAMLAYVATFVPWRTPERCGGRELVRSRKENRRLEMRTPASRSFVQA